jgi:uncharacterized protein
MPTTTLPVNAIRRADILDVLRGFALMGICVANAGYFSLFIFQKPEQLALLPTANADRWLNYFLHAFIDGKFYSLFSLLFGVGFAIIFFQKNGAAKKGLYVFYRRLFFLMVFGLLHSFFLWDGDILFFYAIAGALLPLFRNCSDKTLILLSIVLVFSPLLFDLLKVTSGGQWNISRPFLSQATSVDKRIGISEETISTWLITHDTYKDLRAWNHSGFWWSWQLRLDSNRVPKVAAMFLLGLCIGRSRFYERLNESKLLLRKIQQWCLGIGIPAALAYAYFNADGRNLPGPAGLLDTLFYALSVAPLSIGYATTIALWYNHKPERFSWLQPVGRMALTNYIAQTVFGIAIYYGIGFGAGSNIGPVYFMPVALCIYTVQVLYSRLWMQYFNYGPLEWLWRQLTYGKRLPLVKKAISLPAVGTQA